MGYSERRYRHQERPYNCTNMELKFVLGMDVGRYRNPYNCTNMELKLIWLAELVERRKLIIAPTWN